MKLIIKVSIVILFICFATKTKAQQDAQFGQYIFNGMHINPAYTGYKEELYLQAFARSQWTGIKGAPQTLSIAADEAIHRESIGLGLIVNKDKIGAQSSLSATANFSYRIKLNLPETEILAFGLGAGLTQIGLDGTVLNAIEQGDNRIPSGTVSQITPEIRTGVHYSNEKFFIGFSATGLLTKNLSVFKDYQLLNVKPQTHLYFTSGLALPVNDNFVFKPTFLIKDDLKGPTSLDLNAFVLLKERIWLGLAYRTSLPLYKKSNLQQSLPRSAAVGFIGEYFISKNFRVGYGYDFSLNKLQNYDYGSHEISVAYYFITAKSYRPKCYF